MAQKKSVKFECTRMPNGMQQLWRDSNDSDHSVRFRAGFYITQDKQEIEKLREMEGHPFYIVEVALDKVLPTTEAPDEVPPPLSIGKEKEDKESEE